MHTYHKVVVVYATNERELPRLLLLSGQVNDRTLDHRHIDQFTVFREMQVWSDHWYMVYEETQTLVNRIPACQILITSYGIYECIMSCIYPRAA